MMVVSKMKLCVEKIMHDMIKQIHFVGIGGIGMSGIAEILHNLGHSVQGSDIDTNNNITRLTSLGIKIFIGHNEANIKNSSVVVKSSAIKDSNPEILAARLNNIPVITRAEMLAELMRLKISIAIAGTHGKTTTTSLVAAMFENANKYPTVINGGIINTHGTNAYLGNGDYLIAEADESDATFIKVPATIGVITNIDPEHLDFYGSFENIKSAFKTFIENLPFYGFAVLCKDHPQVSILANQIIDRKIITYGIDNEDVNFRAINIRNGIDGSYYDVKIAASLLREEKILKNIFLPISGIHNVLNSLAAIAIAVELDFDENMIIKGFSNFKGVKRRFTKTGEVNKVTIIDDYAHHPQEIIVTLKNAKELSIANNGRVIAVFQPHRYSRIHDLFSEFINCFNDSDVLVVSDIYSAGEVPISGISKEVLVSAIIQNGYKGQALSLDSTEELAELINKIAKPNDLVIFMGAGSSTYWAHDLPQKMQDLQNIKIKVAI